MVLPARLIVTLLLVLSLTACARKPVGQRYELQGRVVAVDASARQLTIAHRDIPGLMEGMTMPFLVNDRDAWVFNAISPGDQVHATLVLTDHAELQDITFTRHSDRESDGATALHI